MVRRILLLTVALVVAVAETHAAPPASFTRVEVAPTRTSIYVGTVSMTMPTFVRNGSNYEASYTAKVFPYFFYNEKGHLVVTITDEQLGALAKGQPIEFVGQATRDDGALRRVTGRATPKDASSGTLKVRVFVSKRIELIFNTTYRFRD